MQLYKVMDPEVARGLLTCPVCGAGGDQLQAVTLRVRTRMSGVEISRSANFCYLQACGETREQLGPVFATWLTCLGCHADWAQSIDLAEVPSGFTDDALGPHTPSGPLDQPHALDLLQSVFAETKRLYEYAKALAAGAHAGDREARLTLRAMERDLRGFTSGWLDTE